MYCESCRHFIESARSGFVVCPNCKHVNIASSPVPVYASNSLEPTKPRHFPVIKVSKAKLRLAIISVSALVALSSLAFGVQKNIYAQQRVDQAISLDKAGKYQDAAKALKETQSAMVLSYIKEKAKTESVKNQEWLEYHGYQLKAESLMRNQKYDEALALLRKINKNFPTYATVDAHIQNIAKEQALAALRAAEAAKAAEEAARKKATTTKKKTSATVACSAPAIKGKRYVNIGAFSNVTTATTISQVEQALQGFFDQYGLRVEITSISPPSTWKASSGFTYAVLGSQDLCSLKTFSSLLVDEWAKYPVAWSNKSGVKTIIIAKDMRVIGDLQGTTMPVSATYDTDAKYMYYSPSLGSGDYARQIIHHELYHHFAYSYTFVPPYSFSSIINENGWKNFNPAGFTYLSGGGAICHQTSSCLIGEHPTPGFVTGYAASAMPEDQAEVHAYLMSAPHYSKLKSWVASDSYLAGKVNFMKQIASGVAGDMSGEYFNQINP